MKPWTILALFLLAGCAETGSHSQDRFDALDAKVKEMTNASAHLCIVRTDGSIGDCGLIYDGMRDANGSMKIPESCHGKADDACLDRLAKMYNAQMQLRYPLASRQRAQTLCDAEGGCDAREWERKLLILNNLAVGQQYVEQLRIRTAQENY